ncbi:uncharacterized protein LOC116011138 [Ipomoea triloba]|uniref:uncharacterized protein LOC116011138 n=1 Tax=Ipomoea triloba TaxID=35885 RepID=UPI00125D82D6|nr:uncharacterized protein LOC116011138 [Ipomoea triloba]
MAIDKTWMEISDRSLSHYEKGVKDFFEFAFKNLDKGRDVRCPCKKCRNIIFRKHQIIYEHLILNGINKDYKQWYHHGEDFEHYEDDDDDDDERDTSDTNDGMRDMLDDLGRGNTEFFGQFNDQNEGVDAPRGNPTSPNKEAAKFYRLLLELEQELYPGCEESSTLSFIVELLNWKCLYGISANVVDGVLQIMKKNGFCMDQLQMLLIRAIFAYTEIICEKQSTTRRINC